MILVGPPVPPLIFIGRTINVAPTGGSRSRLATFSKEQIAELRALAEALLVITEAEYDSEFDRVWDFLDSLPSSNLQSILITASRSSSKPAHKARKRFG